MGMIKVFEEAKSKKEAVKWSKWFKEAGYKFKILKTPKGYSGFRSITN